MKRFDQGHHYICRNQINKRINYLQRDVYNCHKSFRPPGLLCFLIRMSLLAYVNLILWRKWEISVIQENLAAKCHTSPPVNTYFDSQYKLNLISRVDYLIFFKQNNWRNVFSRQVSWRPLIWHLVVWQTL